MSGTEYTFVIKTKLKPASAVVEANQAFRELLQTQKYPGALNFPSTYCLKVILPRQYDAKAS